MKPINCKIQDHYTQTGVEDLFCGAGMLKRWISVLAGLCLMLSACGNDGNNGIQIGPSETVREYETLSYGEFKARTRKEAEFYHADRFMGDIPGSSLCIIYEGEYDEDLAGPVLSDDDRPIRLQGALGALMDGIDGEMPITELAAALSEGGAAKAVCELLDGADSAYYVGDRYADIPFDSDRDGEYDSRLLISLNDAEEKKVNSESTAWLELIEPEER